VSSHPKSGKRSERDFYVTPVEAVTPLVADLRARWGKSYDPELLDPGAGTGSITQALRAGWPTAHITAIEIDPQHQQALYEAEASEVVIADFLTRPIAVGADIIVANPPFTLACEFIDRSREYLNHDGIMAILLQLNILGSEVRVDWWKGNPPPDAIRALAPRPSFDGAGADSVDYAWFIWDRFGAWDPFGWYHWRETRAYAKRRALPGAVS
jgi:hypothetical protein